ncbi:MAG: hypothetical protein V1742_02275, partial [Pseudomonadota bacterium]
TSKNLPSMEMKVYQHNLAVNAFMKLVGIEPEQPRIYLENPDLKYLVVSINNQIPVAVADGASLVVNPGDTIEVIHVESNYDRGLSVDILGLGTVNDFRQPFTITKPTFILAQKDHIKFGRVAVVLRPAGAPATMVAAKPSPPAQADKQPAADFQVKSFVLEVNGQSRTIAAGQRLEVIDGDLLKVVDIVAEGQPPHSAGGARLAVNFKGFVPGKGVNTGEDRGCVVNTAKDLMPQYSLSKTEKIYEVVVEQGKTVLAGMTVRINQPKLEYLVLRTSQGSLRLKNGDRYRINPGDSVQVLDLKTNVPANQGVQVQVLGLAAEDKKSGELPSFAVKEKQTITLIVSRAGLLLGKIVLISG